MRLPGVDKAAKAPRLAPICRPQVHRDTFPKPEGSSWLDRIRRSDEWSKRIAPKIHRDKTDIFGFIGDRRGAHSFQAWVLG